MLLGFAHKPRTKHTRTRTYFQTGPSVLCVFCVPENVLVCLRDVFAACDADFSTQNATAAVHTDIIYYVLCK